MPSEVITLQLGQCGNQSIINVARKNLTSYLAVTLEYLISLQKMGNFIQGFNRLQFLLFKIICSCI
jgi:hypothetical protein